MAHAGLKRSRPLRRQERRFNANLIDLATKPDDPAAAIVAWPSWQGDADYGRQAARCLGAAAQVDR